MASNCLAVCKCSDLNLPLDAESVTPFVTVIFQGEGGDTYISVGNESSPDLDNSAVVKSFEYGASDGAGCEIEILDEEGGAFEQFANKISNIAGSLSESIKVSVEFGWIAAMCDGGKMKKSSKDVTPLYLLLKQVEVTFADGKVKFKCVCTDKMQDVFASRTNKSQGTDDNKMKLKDAIRQCYENEDPVVQVSYRKRIPGGKYIEDGWDFAKDPKCAWEASNQNKMTTTNKWIEPFRTTNDLGVFPSWDNTTPDGKYVLWENTLDMLESQGGGGTESDLGTYIVNGGKCGDVISFSPTISMFPPIFEHGQGGKLGPGSAEADRKEIEDEEEDYTGGLETSVPPSRYAWDVYGADEMLNETDKSQNAHAKAAFMSMAGQPIKAELKIQGDPMLCHPILLTGNTVSVVVINPFRLTGGGESDCGDWLAKPAVNGVMTSKKWMLKKIGHSIKEGSYVTTMSLELVPSKN